MSSCAYILRLPRVVKGRQGVPAMAQVKGRSQGRMPAGSCQLKLQSCPGCRKQLRAVFLRPCKFRALSFRYLPIES
eukprot:8738287-Alexandrium_andersonii.AAC.1